MPRVPTYDAQVAPAPLPGPTTSAGAGSTGLQTVGAALEKTATALYERERKKADDVALLGADRELATFETGALYDPKAGALTKKGRDAFDLPDTVIGAFDARVADIEKRLVGDQKVRFRAVADRRRVDVDRTVQRHVAQEIRAYDASETEAYLSNSLDAAAANYTDPVRVSLEVGRQQGAVLQHAERNGLPAEWSKLKMGEWASKTHLAVLGRMLSGGDDAGAAAYYAQVKGEIRGTEAAGAQKAVEEATFRGQAQRHEDAIVARHLGDREGALVAARALTDPKQRDEVLRRVTLRFDEQKRLEAEARADAYEVASTQIEGGARVDQVPPQIRARLSSEQLAGLERRERDRRLGIEPVQQDRAWLRFMDLPAETLARMPEGEFLGYRAQFDHAHWHQAVARRAAAREAVEKGQRNPELSATLTFRERVDNGLRTSGLIDPSKKAGQFSDAEVRVYARFEAAAAGAVEHFELTQLGGKRKATGEEQQAIIDGLLVRRVFIDRPFQSDLERQADTLADDEKGRAYVPVSQIPAQARDEMTAVVRSLGKAVTDDKLQRMRAARLLNDRARYLAIAGE